MSMSIVMHAYSLRYMVPTSIMLGSLPISLSIWTALRLLTLGLPQRFYTSLDDRLFDMYLRLILFFFNTVTGIKINMYGDTSVLNDEKENAIVLMNHQCTVDWVVATMLASSQGSMGSTRYMVKDGLRYFPLCGFYFRQHSFIFVKRDKKFEKEKTEQDLGALKKNNIPVWLVLFPEGTRMNPELTDVINSSKQFAKEQGVDELNQVLMPKAKGLQLSVEQLQGHVTAVYDVTVAYSNTSDIRTGKRLPSPGMLEFLNGASKEISIHFERIPISNVPTEELQLKKWLHGRFLLKDRLLSHFYSNNTEQCGHFPGCSESVHISKRTTFPGFMIFGSCLAFLLATQTGRSLYWRVSLYGSLAGILFMSVKS